MPTEILEKKIGLDVSGDNKPDFQLDIKSIAIVVGFLISGITGYNELKQEIEIAKELPVYEVKQTADDVVVKNNLQFLQKEIDKLEKRVEVLESRVYRK